VPPDWNKTAMNVFDSFFVNLCDSAKDLTISFTCDGDNSWVLGSLIDEFTSD
jgi:hypothetical protein